MLCSSIRETILILSLAQKLLKVLLFWLNSFFVKQQTANRETDRDSERER